MYKTCSCFCVVMVTGVCESNTECSHVYLLANSNQYGQLLKCVSSHSYTHRQIQSTVYLLLQEYMCVIDSIMGRGLLLLYLCYCIVVDWFYPCYRSILVCVCEIIVLAAFFRTDTLWRLWRQCYHRHEHGGMKTPLSFPLITWMSICVICLFLSAWSVGKGVCPYCVTVLLLGWWKPIDRWCLREKLMWLKKWCVCAFFPVCPRRAVSRVGQPVLWWGVPLWYSLLIGLEERRPIHKNCVRGSESCPCIPVKILSAPAFLMAA